MLFAELWVVVAVLLMLGADGFTVDLVCLKGCGSWFFGSELESILRFLVGLGVATMG